MEHELHELANDTNEKQDKIIYKDLSFQIMEAIFEVHNILGPGYTENIYEEALARELENRQISYQRQKLIEVLYKNSKIGEYKLDMIVDSKIILELKAVSQLNDLFQAQILSYLKATKIKLGILVNFGKDRIEYKRIVY